MNGLHELNNSFGHLCAAWPQDDMTQMCRKIEMKSFNYDNCIWPKSNKNNNRLLQEVFELLYVS